jgi:DNA-binding PadR family transcriptional regulator
MEPTVADCLVLAHLASRGPATPAGLTRAVPPSDVHTALRRLERDCLVASSRLERSVNRKRLYRITRNGAEALAVLRLWPPQLAA